MKNLNDLIDSWIGEERNDFQLEAYGEPEKRWIHNSKILGHNQALQDLKSRKQELIEGIVDLIKSLPTADLNDFQNTSCVALYEIEKLTDK